MQIWIIWSAADHMDDDLWNTFSYNLWRALVSYSTVLVYWAEKDMSSISSHAAMWYQDAWWKTLAILYGKYESTREYDYNYYIYTWMERWWWREFVFINSCDIVIVVGWWSWTLNEMTIAYQNKVPILTIVWSWWRADALWWKYLDARGESDANRKKCVACETIDDVCLVVKELKRNFTIKDN